MTSDQFEFALGQRVQMVGDAFPSTVVHRGFWQSFEFPEGRRLYVVRRGNDEHTCSAAELSAVDEPGNVPG